jgi:uncharacterized protein (TIGR02996 family)
MTDRSSFLRAILANPDEDAPRLIYADWLEEQGDADQAEFIRVQCELARLSAETERRTELSRRQWDLLFQHNEEWRSAWLPGQADTQLRYVRGLPEALIGTAADVLAAAEQLQGRAPIRELELHKLKGRGGALAACPLLADIRRIKVIATGGIDSDFLTILHSPYLTGLSALTCAGGFVQPWTLREMVLVPQFRTLTELDLSTNHFANAGLAELIKGVHLLDRLLRLEMSDCSLGDAAIEDWCGQQPHPHLEHLDLSQNHRLGDAAAKALARATHWNHLQVLLLRGTAIHANGAQALARSAPLQQLHRLDLRYNTISDRASSTLRDRFGDRVLLGNDPNPP